jgi:hypothetical protein
MSANLDQARAAQRHLAELLSDIPQLNGIGITRVNEGFGLKANLTDSSVMARVPSEIDGVAVRVEVVGPVFAH